MAAKIIDGKKIAREVLAEVANEVRDLKKEQNLQPGLAVILVGDNPASQVYVKRKTEVCAELGIFSQQYRLPAETSETEVLELIDTLNQQENIHGILVQSPLPKPIDEDLVFNSVDPEKDVDGFHVINVGKLALGDPTGFVACTPAGIVELLRRSGVEIPGKHVVIVGRSRIVGKPMMMLMLMKGKMGDATVTVCHSRSRDLGEMTRQADVLIAAIGKAQMIKADMVREGAVVIDVGINRIAGDGGKVKLVGDVDFEGVSKKASAITPVPGGVGPMTIAMLMSNTVKAARLQNAANVRPEAS
jgi:methylenetetrahydrofolate dehydrogenase (NADP+)/methenyltetrahydrofolate cyclohydrolase